MKPTRSSLRWIGFLLVLTFGVWTAKLRAQPGSPDTTFNVAVTSGEWGFSAVVQPDGKVVAAGTFGVMRFLTDGSVDPSFQSIRPGPAPFNGPGLGIGSVVLQPDGRIIVTGSFTNGAGALLPGVMRLNSDSSIDSSFTLDARVQAGGQVLALQPDGKVLTGGFYDRGGEDLGNLVRLLPNGSLDPDWDARWYNNNAGFYSLTVTPEGKIYFGTYQNVYRVNPNGSLDRDFEPDIGPGPFGALAVQPDGKVLVGHYGDGANYRQVRRLLPSGAADPGWTPPEIGGGDSVVYAILLQPDGKVLVGGNNLMSFNGVYNASLGRLNADGSVDTTFDTLPALQIFSVDDLALAPDGKVVVAGLHTDVAGGYLPAPGISRLNNDAGPRGIEFTASTYVGREGDGWVSIPVRRTGAVDRLAIVRYSAHPGTATRGRDYFGGNGALLFKRGETVKHIRLYIVRDHRTEGFETVRLSLKRALGGILGPQSLATLTILDR